MKVVVKDLISILERLNAGIDDKERIEQSNSYIFSNDNVYTFNDEIAVRFKLPFNLENEFSISAKELFTLLNRVDEKELDLNIEDNKLKVSSDKFNAQFVVEEPKLSLSDISEPTRWINLPSDISKIIKLVSLSASRNLASPILACIHFKDNYIESCDNFRLTRYKFDKRYRKFDLSVFADTINKIASFDLKEVARSDGWLHFKDKDGAMISCRTFEGNYPDLSSIIDKFEGVASFEFPKDTKAAIERAEVMADEDEVGNRFVELVSSDKILSIKTKSPHGRYVEKLKLDSDIEFDLNVKCNLVKEVLDITNKVSTDKKDTTLLFKTDNLVHLISI